MQSILFHIGSFTIYSYGTILALAFILSMIIVLWKSARLGMTRQTIYDLGIWIIIGGLLGARIAYVFLNLDEFKNHLLEIFMIQHGGLAFHGSFIGGVLSLWIFTRLRKLSFFKMLDLVIPPLVLGHSIGRMGCFLNGCCFGTLTKCDWAVNFPANSLPAYHWGKLHLIHPTQIYEAVALLTLFFILLIIDKKKRFDGTTFCFYLLLYPIIRFCTEFFRGDHTLVILNRFTFFQGISVVLFLLGGILYALLSYYDRRRNHQTVSS